MKLFFQCMTCWRKQHCLYSYCQWQIGQSDCNITATVNCKNCNTLNLNFKFLSHFDFRELSKFFLSCHGSQSGCSLEHCYLFDTHIGVITNHCMICYTLFFHLGSGTMFLRPEKIVRHQSLETVDIDRLKDLLVKWVKHGIQKAMGVDS